MIEFSASSLTVPLILLVGFCLLALVSLVLADIARESRFSPFQALFGSSGHNFFFRVRRSA